MGRYKTVWSHAYMWQVRIRRGVLAAEDPLRIKGLSPTTGSPAQSTVLGRGVPRIVTVKNSRDSVYRRCRDAGDPVVPLKGPSTVIYITNILPKF